MGQSVEWEIFVLIDVNGDIICAFNDEFKANKEAKEIGCEIKVVKLYSY